MDVAREMIEKNPCSDETVLNIVVVVTQIYIFGKIV